MVTSVARRKYSGRAETAFKDAVLARYGRVCHLCGGVATTADHLIPRSIRPDLAFEITNGRPACQPCNSGRGNRPLAPVEAAPGW